MSAPSGVHPADPHRDARVLQFGAALEQAEGVVILLHGRGGSAEDILSLARSLYDPRLCYLAPQAAGHSWYPLSFLAPREENEPWLSSALRSVEALVEKVGAAGVTRERVVIGGFSQGACLSTEFVARHPGRYAGLIAFTGGLIGPPGMETRYAGDLAGTPASLGSGDPDPHVPWTRVEESARVLKEMGADVTVQQYPGRPHTITPEELGIAARLVRNAFPAAD